MRLEVTREVKKEKEREKEGFSRTRTLPEELERGN
jgi:hypothetical protein